MMLAMGTRGARLAPWAMATGATACQIARRLYRAAVCSKLGAPLSVENQQPKELKATDVCIDVHYAAVNYADILMCAGTYQEKAEVPFVPGAEAVGVVSAVGKDVKNIAVGDMVGAMSAAGGAYAEKLVADFRSVLKLPKAIKPEIAVTLPVSYGTALMGLQRRAALQEGETVLITAAAGAAGLAAVDIAKHMYKCKVIGAASSDTKEEAIREAGADHFINYTRDSIKDKVMEFTGRKGVDVVYEIVGGSTALECLRCLAWEGRLVTVGFAGGDIPKFPANLLLLKSASVCGVYFGAYSRQNPPVFGKVLTDVFTNTATGVLKPHPATVYDLDDVNVAFQAVRSRTSVGKVVLKIQ